MHLRALKVADATCERTARSKCCHGHDFIYNLILIQWHLEAKTHAIYSHFGWIWLVLLDHYAVIIDRGFVCVWERRVFRTIFHGKCFEVRRMKNQCDAAGNREGRHRWRWSYVVLEKAWRQHSPLEHNLFAWTISTCFCLTLSLHAEDWAQQNVNRTLIHCIRNTNLACLFSTSSALHRKSNFSIRKSINRRNLVNTRIWKYIRWYCEVIHFMRQYIHSTVVQYADKSELIWENHAIWAQTSSSATIRCV